MYLVRLQALIDRRKVIITEDTIRQALRLNDADSTDCLPNEEIFAELARMGMLVPQQVQDDVADAVEDEDAANEISTESTPPLPTPATTPPSQQTSAILNKKVEDLEQDKIAQAIEITKLKQRARRLSGGCIQTERKLAELDADDDDKGKGILVEEPKPLKRQAQIEQDKAFARELEAKLKANINWNEVIEQVKRKERQDNTIMRYQSLKRKPVTEAQARKNMMVYLKNMAGFKMHFFKGMTYTDIRPIFEKHFTSVWDFQEKGEKELEEEDGKRKGESLKEKPAKKQNIDEEVEELKTRLQIVPNDEDDVYNEATPLALKVPVVDYQIHTENNKPYYKIIRVDGTHHLFLSFISLLRNINREDLEMLWKIVQERFVSSELKNFSNDFMLDTLKTMFEKPNVEASIWRNQRGRYGLAKVKIWKLLESVKGPTGSEQNDQLVLIKKDPSLRGTVVVETLKDSGIDVTATKRRWGA
nr:hypothetical protein [Tanacetum cinerariifolium]